MGSPIRRSPGQSLFSDSPELIAASHVLHRLPAPRHPPYALSSLTIKFGQDKNEKCRFIELSKISGRAGPQLGRALSQNSRLKPNRMSLPRRRGECGGADRNRTGDLRRAKPALSQLSYSPDLFIRRSPGHALSVVVRLQDLWWA